MTDKMIKNDLHTVRQLTEKFFNATLSDHESERLSGYAEELTGKNPPFEINDMQLLNDLELIKSLNSHSEACLEALALQTPQELELKLESHISRLARDSRRRMIFKRILPSAAAAAVVAVVATIGFKATEGIGITGHDSQQYASVTPALKSENTLSSQMNAKSETPVFAELNRPIKPSPAAKVSHAATITPVIPPPAIKAIATAATATLPEKINIPNFSDPVIDVMPMIAAASIDPSKVVLQPLSTLSQTVCNVYESVDAVSSSFAGIAETLELVNSSLALLSSTDDNF